MDKICLLLLFVIGCTLLPHTYAYESGSFNDVCSLAAKGKRALCQTTRYSNIGLRAAATTHIIQSNAQWQRESERKWVSEWVKGSERLSRGTLTHNSAKEKRQQQQHQLSVYVLLPLWGKEAGKQVHRAAMRTNITCHIQSHSFAYVYR